MKIDKKIICLCILFLSFLFDQYDVIAQTTSQVTTSTSIRNEFKKRSEKILSFYDTLKSPDYYSTAVKYARRVDVETANKNVLQLLKEPRGDMFWMIAALAAYLHGKDYMSQEVKDAMRRTWKTYPPYRGDTENHWAMYYSALYLAAEQWSNLNGDEWYNGKSSDENLREAKEYLLNWIKTTTTIGQGEFDSPDYMPIYLNAMILLNDFAQDRQIKKAGQMMIDYLLADFAVEHFHGQYIGGYSRVYEPAVYEPFKTNIAGVAHLLFGEGIETRNATCVLFALSSYRLPEIIFNIATDRSQPYIHKERKRTRNIIRYGKDKNLPVYKYDYMTNDYALGSLQGGILQPIQQHTWGLNFNSDSSTKTIFGLHPYWSGLELGMFFPEETKTMIADVVASKGTYNNPNKWTGSSPFEQTFQHKNTLIVLYDIASGTTTDRIDGFFPKSLDTCYADKSGWIISKAHDVYVGWYPLQQYQWIEEKKNYRLRSNYLQNGLVLEVRSRNEIGSFEKFVKALRKKIPSVTLTANHVCVNYKTLGGDLLEFDFNKARKINTKIVDLTKYKLFDGPFLHAVVNREKLFMTYKNQRRVLDFKNFTITDK